MRWAVAVSPTDAARPLAIALDLPLTEAPDGFDGLVHAGSDASLARLVDLVGPDVPIVHAPTVPSDLARMFGPVDAGHLIDHGSPYAVDLLEATSEVGRVPAIAHAVASSTGSLPRVRARRSALTIERDGRSLEVADAAGLVIANAQHLGGLTVAPRSALMDGLFDVQVVSGGPIERLRTRRAMERGLHMRRSSVRRRTASELRFDLPPGWHLSIDGRPAPGRSWHVRTVPNGGTLWV